MPEFQFRLQALLDQKLGAENLARLAVAEKWRQLAEEEAALQHAAEKEKRIERLALQTRERLLEPAGQSSAAGVQRRDNYLQALRQDQHEAHEDTLVRKFAVEDAETALNEARARLLDCSREAKTLTKYRAKLETRFLAEIAAKEDREQDEIGTVMYSCRGLDA